MSQPTLQDIRIQLQMALSASKSALLLMEQYDSAVSVVQCDEDYDIEANTLISGQHYRRGEDAPDGTCEQMRSAIACLGSVLEHINPSAEINS